MGINKAQVSSVHHGLLGLVYLKQVRSAVCWLVHAIWHSISLNHEP
jgi:hypothetical protein